MSDGLTDEERTQLTSWCVMHAKPWHGNLTWGAVKQAADGAPDDIAFIAEKWIDEAAT